jgi:hypothetical protein
METLGGGGRKTLLIPKKQTEVLICLYRHAVQPIASSQHATNKMTELFRRYF